MCPIKLVRLGRLNFIVTYLYLLAGGLSSSDKRAPEIFDSIFRGAFLLKFDFSSNTIFETFSNGNKCKKKHNT